MIHNDDLLPKVFAAALVLICWGMLVIPEPAMAQGDEPNLYVATSVVQASYNALSETPIMISVIMNGEMVKQTEAQVNSNTRFTLPAGIYDIRLEGDGMQTLVKRGIQVKAGERSDAIGGPMRVGVGVKTIEYATGGLSREEVAARLAKLETAVAELQKARQGR